jgi:DNA-binding transcriptional ArsR family regulator
LRQWYRILSRSSDFLNFDLHQRIAVTMLELAADFGITDSRGSLLMEPFSHDDIAELVGASRPRITEHLARLERAGLLSRQGRRFIVRGNICSALEANLDFAISAEEPSVYAEAVPLEFTLRSK